MFIGHPCLFWNQIAVPTANYLLILHYFVQLKCPGSGMTLACPHTLLSFIIVHCGSPGAALSALLQDLTISQYEAEILPCVFLHVNTSDCTD